MSKTDTKKTNEQHMITRLAEVVNTSMTLFGKNENGDTALKA